MKYKVYTAVSTEPVSLTEVKLQLRLDSDDTTEDSLLNRIITVAREYGEMVTRRAFAEQTIEAYADEFPSRDFMELPMPPLQSVTSVKYKDSDGDETTMTEDTEYIVDTDSDIGRLVLPYGDVWPSFTAYPVNPIKVRYVAGYTTLPKTFKQAMLLHIGFLYKYRDAEIPEGDMGTVRRMYQSKKARWF